LPGSFLTAEFEGASSTMPSVGVVSGKRKIGARIVSWFQEPFSLGVFDIGTPTFQQWYIAECGTCTNPSV
jgi:hypothetical protein